jgi:ATP-dependent helicase IRC3
VDELRPYQAEAIRAIRSGLSEGHKRQLISLPTGTGKGTILAQAPARLGLLPALILVDRIKLVEQTANVLRKQNPHLSVAIEQAEHYADLNADLTVASVPTIARDDGKRMQEWDPCRFQMVISDEAHHDLSNTRIATLRYFQPKLLLGTTATAWRTDEQPLARIYDAVVYEKSIRWAVENGWLCPFRARKIKTTVDISNLHIRGSDFVEKDLAKAINVNWRNSEIISGVEKWAEDRKSILYFAVDQAHAEALRNQLRKRGHDAEMILDWTPKGEKDNTFARFEEGDLRHLVNVGVVGEGVDIPRIDCIVFARPWKSSLPFVQGAGRGLRPFPGKEYCLFLDVADKCGRHKIMSASQLLGERDIDCLGRDVLDVVAETEAMAEEWGIQAEEGESIDEAMKKMEILRRLSEETVYLDTEAEVADLFSAIDLSSEVKRDSIFAWIKITGSRYVLHLDGGVIATLWANRLGEWKLTDGAVEFPLGVHQKPPFFEADRLIKKIDPTWRMRKMGAKWWSLEPTPKQLEFLRDRMEIDILPNEHYTRGAAMRLISTFSVLRKLGVGELGAKEAR